MKFAGHEDPRIFAQSYMSDTSSVGGVGNILGLARRGDISKHFRGLSLHRHSRLWQSLSAKVR